MENGQLNDKLISVIVPVYNTKPYLRRCVESIRNQTYRNLEIILVDDGSTDGSGDLCDEIAAEDVRICVIHQKNQGLSAARNSGIAIAKGELLGFIDSDDYIYHGMYQKLKTVLQNNNADIAIGGIIMTQNEDYFGNRSYYNWNEEIFSKEQAVIQLFDNYTDAVSACNKLYKKEMFQKIVYPVGKKHEDEYVTYKLLYMANKVVFVKEKMYAYMQREGSIVHTPGEKSLLDKIEAYEQVMMYCEENKLLKAYERAVYRYLDFRREYYEWCKRQKKEYTKDVYNSILAETKVKKRIIRFENKNYCKSLLFRFFPSLFIIVKNRVK